MSSPPARIFSWLDTSVKHLTQNRKTEELDASGKLPRGVFYIPSRKTRLEEDFLHNGKLYKFKGEPDAYILSNDRPQKILAVVDFKTGKPSESKNIIYKRQLLLYGWLLTVKTRKQAGVLFAAPENPPPHIALGYLSPVPETLRKPQNHTHPLTMDFEIEWEVYQFNLGEAQQLVNQILSILSSAQAPQPAPACPWCQYREWARQTGY